MQRLGAQDDAVANLPAMDDRLVARDMDGHGSIGLIGNDRRVAGRMRRRSAMPDGEYREIEQVGALAPRAGAPVEIPHRRRERNADEFIKQADGRRAGGGGNSG